MGDRYELGSRDGHKPTNRPTGEPEEDARRFQHPMVNPEKDGRAVCNTDKFAVIQKFLSGEFVFDELEPKRIRDSFRLTNKEKAMLVRDTRFRDWWEGRLLDVVIGAWRPSRQQIDAFKMLGRKLGFYKDGKDGNGASKVVNVGKLVLRPRSNGKS